MTAAKEQNIIIVGGGLAGLACSLGLAKLGFHVDIIESRATWLQKGSAFGLAANARKALEELFHDPASLGKMISKGILVEGMDSYLMVWGIVRDGLLEEVEKCPNISIHMGTTISSFDDFSDQSKIEVVVKDVDDETKVEKLDAVLMVAADGVYSSTRGMLDLEPSKFATVTRWRGALTIPHGSILEQFLDKGVTPLRMDDSTKGMTSGECVLSIFNFHPKIERKMTFVMNAHFVAIPHGTHPREIFFEHMKDPFHQSILEEIFKCADDQEIHWPLAQAVIQLPEDGTNGWGGKGRVTLIGDAAHAMRPASGLGGAMAFEDSVVLCRLLKAKGSSLETRDGANGLVREFESSRFERVKRIWDNQWEISERVYKKGDKAPGMMTPEFRKWVENGV